MAQTKTILSDLKQAMLLKQTDKVSVLRMLVAGLKNTQIEKGDELSEQEVLKVIKKEAKKRQEAILMYQKAKRDELVTKEKQELEILKQYLPEELGAEKVKKLILDLKESGELKDNFGGAMKLVMEKLKGQADGKMVAELLREML